MKNRVSIKCVVILSLIICLSLILAACIACKPDETDEHSHSFKETVIDPTCTEDGYTLHECACGESYKDSFVTATDHSPKLPIRENIVPASCSAEGGYDEVVYCDVCNEKLSTEHKTIGKLEHSPKTPIQENKVPASCSTDGGYDEVVYCDVCNEKLSTEHKTIGKLEHSPKTPIQENKVPASCSTEGGYDEVVYCDVCNEKLSTEHKTIGKLEHSPKTPIQENKVPASCSTEGGYDEVVYCDICNEKLSIEHKTIGKLEHSFKEGTCSVCGGLYYNTEDLQFTLSQDGSYYYVSGFNGNPTYANIPSEYLDKPVKSIGSSAFEGCESLTSLTLPNGLISIGYSAFYQCRNLQSVTVPEGVTSIGQYAFEGCLGLTSVTVPNSLSSIDKSAFANCTKVASVYYTGSIAEFCNVSGIGNLMGYAADKKLYLNGEEITELIIPNDITSIKAETFYGCGGLKSVTFGEGVKSIGDYAFANCSSLKTVFWNAVNCEGGWFVESSDITSISGIFNHCDNFTDVVIGNNVQSIPAYLFYCSSVASVNIPDSVTSIGKSAFYQCNGLKTITIGRGVTSIGGLAFESCASLETVYWNATDCQGGWFDDQIKPVFYQCDNLTSAVIGDGVLFVPSYLFYRCYALQSVTIGQNVESMGKSVFAHCTSLATVYWNATDCDSGWVENTSLYLLFSDCGNFKTLVIGNGVEAIPDYLCYKCGSLETVIVPASMVYVGKYAFNSCGALKTVFYLGGEDDFFSASSGNTEFMDALYYYAETDPADSGQWWHYDENGNMVTW